MPVHGTVSHEVGLGRAGEFVHVAHRGKRRQTSVGVAVCRGSDWSAGADPLRAGGVGRSPACPVAAERNCTSSARTCTAGNSRRVGTVRSWREGRGCTGCSCGAVYIAVGGSVVGSLDVRLGVQGRPAGGHAGLPEVRGSRVAEAGVRVRDAVHHGREPANGLLLFSLGLVLVVGVLLHVRLAKFLGLFDVRSFLLVREVFPLGPEPLADLRVVHLGILVCDFFPHLPRPDHEGVHGSLDFVVVIFTLRGLPLGLRRGRRRLDGAHVAVGRGILEGHDMHHS